jgi:cell division protein FtsW (lipid II flippase)
MHHRQQYSEVRFLPGHRPQEPVTANVSTRAWPRSSADTAIVVCAVTATLAGLAYLGLVGAPTRFLTMNAVTLVLAIALVRFLSALLAGRLDATAGPICLGGALVLLATAVLGPDVEGIRRWLEMGPILLQTGLVLLPLMLVLFARSPDRLATAGIVLASAALALQPDRALATALAGGLAVLLGWTRRPTVVLAFLASLAASITAFLQPDGLPAVEHVEGVLANSFRSGIRESTIVLAGTLLLLSPPIFGGRRSRLQRRQLAVFGGFWLITVLAAAQGAYPTPLLGYGPSAIIGYVLCSLAFSSASCRVPSLDR